MAAAVVVAVAGAEAGALVLVGVVEGGLWVGVRVEREGVMVMMGWGHPPLKLPRECTLTPLMEALPT